MRSPLCHPFLFLALSSATLVARDWHVAPNAPADGLATIEAPTGDLATALKQAQAGDVIHLCGGTWRGKFSLGNSGTAEQPIALQAAAGTTPILTCLQELQAEKDGHGTWEKVSATVWRVRVSDEWAEQLKDVNKQQLFCDGQLGIPARWPNTTEPLGYDRDDYGTAEGAKILQDIPADKEKKKMAESVGRYEASGLKSFAKNALLGGQVRTIPGMGWWHESGPVQASEPGSVDFLYSRFMNGRLDVVYQRDPFFVFGRLALLDAEREFYLDVEGRDGSVNMLYLHLAVGDHPAKHRWELRLGNETLLLTERSYITVRGLHFHAGAVISWRDSQYLTLDHCRSSYAGWNYSKRGAGGHSVSLCGEHHTVSNCQIMGSTTNGLHVKGSHAHIHDCVISHCGNQCVKLEGANHVVEYNTMGICGSHCINIVPATVIRMNHIFLAGQAITDVASVNVWDGGDMKNGEAHHNWAYRCDPPLEGYMHWNGGCGLRVDNGGAPKGVCNLHYHHNVVWGDSARNDIMGWSLEEHQAQYKQMNWSSRHNTCDRNVLILREGKGSLGGSIVQNNIADQLNLFNQPPEGVTTAGNVWAINAERGGIMAKPTFMAPHLHDYRPAAQSPAGGKAIAYEGNTAPTHAGAYQKDENWLPGARIQLDQAEQRELLKKIQPQLRTGLAGGSFLFLPLPEGRLLAEDTVVLLDNKEHQNWRQQFLPDEVNAQLIIRLASVPKKLTLRHGEQSLDLKIGKATVGKTKKWAKLVLPELTMHQLRSDSLRLKLTAVQAKAWKHFRIVSDDEQHEMTALREDSDSYLLRLAKPGSAVVWSKSEPPSWYVIQTKASDAVVDFHPVLQNENLRIWLRADDLATGPCSTWPNMARGNTASLFSAYQAEKQRRPQVVMDGPGGRPTVRFDGNDDFLDLGPPEGLGEGAFEIYVVWAAPEAPGTESYQRWSRLIDVRFPGEKVSRKDNEGKLVNLVKALNFETKDKERLGCVIPTEKTVIYHQSFRRGDDKPIILGRMRLAAAELEKGPYHFLKGDVSEILIFDRELSLEEQDQVQDYLNKRYLYDAKEQQAYAK